MNINECYETAQKLKDNIQKVIIGKDETILKILTAVIAGGNILLEDTPGTGKTLLSKSLARSIDASFQRIQFTPDLLPSDVTGMNIYNQKESCFTFIPGPAFCNVLLADEINRATPRTQSSLLECMEEHQITVDGKTRALDSMFFVIATQNPIETAGTYPLPEAQMDRFMMQLSMGYPKKEEELLMIDRFIVDDPLTELKPVCTKEDIAAMRECAKTIFVHPSVREYIVDIVNATRNNSYISMGASPRATLALLKAAMAYAMLHNRDYLLPDDVKELAFPVLKHRMLVYGNSDINQSKHPLQTVLDSVTVPSETFNVR